MKKIFTIITLAAALALHSCVFADHDEVIGGGNGDGLTFIFDIEGHGGSQTRSISPETGEDMVYSLAFLFFDKTEDGSGTLKGYTVIRDAAGFKMNTPHTLALPSGLSGSDPYNLLVAANLDKSKYIDRTIEDWCETFAGRTERQVRLGATIAAQGSVDSATDDAVKIPQDGIAMGTFTTLNAGQTTVSFTLLRSVARFDVYTSPSETEYKLVSASIWNAMPSSALWTARYVDFSGEHLKRFYGVQHDSASEGQDIVGGLYSLENYVFEPAPADAVTTCLILGYRGPDGIVTYHRVNVRPDNDLSQDLVRNNVYKINITDVLGPGRGSEIDAYTEQESKLVCGILEWGVDTGDLIQTSQGNILGVPAKRIRLAPEGETRTLSIFTMGSGVLAISRFESSDPALTAWLEDTSLKIKGEPFYGVTGERQAVVEVSFAGMKASISIVQSASGDVYLELSTDSVPVFAPTAGSSMAGGIAVSASGSWNARLAVNSTVEGNVFTFQAGTDKDTLHSSETVADVIVISTRTANPGATRREAVLIVALDSNPDVTRTLVLTQSAVPTITTLPVVSAITFNAYGGPTSANTLAVNPGEGLDVQSWTVAMTGGDAEKFTATKDPVTGLVTVTANFNTISRDLSARLRISILGTDTYLEIPVTQSSISLSYTPAAPALVPVTGGDSQEITMITDVAQRKWTAQLVETRTTSGAALANGHEATILVGGSTTNMTGTGSTDKIVVRFPKLLTPNVGVTPEAVIKVTLLDDGGNPTGITATITVRQQPLNPRAIVAQSYNSGYFSFGVNNGTGGSYGGIAVSAFMRNTSHFGPSGTVVTNSQITTPAAYFNIGTIALTTTLLNANRAIDLTQAHWDMSKTWWQAKDGNTLLIASDDYSDYQFTRFLNGQGYTRYVNTESTNTRINVANAQQSNNPKLMAYLLDGPFGHVDLGNVTSFISDAVHTKLDEYPPTASPVIVYNFPNGTWKAMLTIDIEKQLVFIGDGQMFYVSGIADTGTAPTSDRGRFLANIIAVWVNLSQYGSHWGDNYIE